VLLLFALLLRTYSSVIAPINELNLSIFYIFYVGGLFSEGSRKYFGIIQNDFALELTGLLFIIGGLLVAFSKVKREDEFILKIWLESLVWATYFNAFVLLSALLFVYGGAFVDILFYNFPTILILFIARFHWVYYQAQRVEIA